MIGAIVQWFRGWRKCWEMDRDHKLEQILHSKHLQPGHFYLFVYDMRSISRAVCIDLQKSLHTRGIESGFLRVRGALPLIYDLKQPEEEL